MVSGRNRGRLRSGLNTSLLGLRLLNLTVMEISRMSRRLRSGARQVFWSSNFRVADQDGSLVSLTRQRARVPLCEMREHLHDIVEIRVDRVFTSGSG